ncbi:MAG: HD domain-containing protein [Firmicutes bacterium]|mgnify:CR=1 FL=1|nr:HD domain-containing protein [Bacillota bacterium]
MQRTEIINLLSKTLSKPRFDHCLSVESMALELADHFHISSEILSPAALLHDLCREYSREKLLKLAAGFDIVVDDIEKAEPLLLHGSIAAAIAEKNLNINNSLVLEAVRFHITGAPNMAPLAKLIFIADFIEPGRTFEQARILREMAFKLSPDQLLLKVYNRSIEFVIRQGYLIHPRTVAGRNELIMKGVTD